MNTHLRCRTPPQIGTGGRATLASITASWRTGSAGSPRSAGAPGPKGNCSASPGGMMPERIALAGALMRRNPRDARMDVAGAARNGDAHNVAADAYVLTVRASPGLGGSHVDLAVPAFGDFTRGVAFLDEGLAPGRVLWVLAAVPVAVGRGSRVISRGFGATSGCALTAETGPASFLGPLGRPGRGLSRRPDP